MPVENRHGRRKTIVPGRQLESFRSDWVRVCAGGATSYFETGLFSRLAHAAIRRLLGAAALLSMRLQRPLCPHAEEARSAVSKYEVARPPGPIKP
jgi:hypothetical protein